VIHIEGAAVWEQRKFEAYLKARLEADHGESGRQRFSVYEVTRGKLLNDIYEQIPGAEPNLSDHGPKHIANVLDNARHLLGQDHEEHRFSSTDLYVLAIGILFHDVGNMYGRKDHHKKLAAIFDWARGTDASVKREKILVLKMARAHTGFAADGSRDTLKELAPDHLNGEAVQLQSLGAVLRFADELAEGPQRISDFRRRLNLYDVSSQLYIDYGAITSVHIDRQNERVLLTYDVKLEDCGSSTKEQRAGLGKLLQFAFDRARKLNQERQYARHYCHALDRFRATGVAINFLHEGDPVAIDLPQLLLNDKVVPGDASKDFEELDERFRVPNLVSAVFDAIHSEGAQ
jgi:hypothetical protein